MQNLFSLSGFFQTCHLKFLCNERFEKLESSLVFWQNQRFVLILIKSLGICWNLRSRQQIKIFYVFKSGENQKCSDHNYHENQGETEIGWTMKKK